MWAKGTRGKGFLACGLQPFPLEEPAIKILNSPRHIVFKYTSVSVFNRDTHKPTDELRPKIYPQNTLSVFPRFILAQSIGSLGQNN